MTGAVIKPEFSSRAMRKVTEQTLRLLDECLLDGDAIIDIGCGNGYVLWQLSKRGRYSDLLGVDIVDIRRAPVPSFKVYDGTHVPVPDKSYDVSMFNFVLHHVPNSLKPRLLEEARRITRRCVFIMEDTPVNFIDRLLNELHGRRYRSYIGNKEAPFGFYTKEEWEALFESLGFKVKMSRRLGRFSRQWRHPFARSVFVLEV